MLAFHFIKIFLLSPLLVKYYEPDKPLVLQCDRCMLEVSCIWVVHCYKTKIQLRTQAEHLREQKWTKLKLIKGCYPLSLVKSVFNNTGTDETSLRIQSINLKTPYLKTRLKKQVDLSKFLLLYDIDTSYNNVSEMHQLQIFSKQLFEDEEHEVRSEFEEQPIMCQRWKTSTKW